MSNLSLPDPGALVKTGEKYALDLAERVLSTFVVSAAGVAVAAGPADMFHATFWQTVAAAGVAAAGSLVKGILARGFGSKNSASLAKGV